jgi:hypothetical protein
MVEGLSKGHQANRLKQLRLHGTGRVVKHRREFRVSPGSGGVSCLHQLFPKRVSLDVKFNGQDLAERFGWQCQNGGQ